MANIAVKRASDTLIRDAMTEKIINEAQKIVTAEGADQLNVRRILSALGITNRVFYNRFHNVGEVLDTVYRVTVTKMQESVRTEIDPDRDFFEQVTDIVEHVLTTSYDVKKQFNHYIFENDSLNENTREWWVARIKELILYAKRRELIAEVDENILSYSIWCFCRGYNADAVGRNIPREEAVKRFQYSFGILLDGMKI